MQHLILLLSFYVIEFIMFYKGTGELFLKCGQHEVPPSLIKPSSFSLPLILALRLNIQWSVLKLWYHLPSFDPDFILYSSHVDFSLFLDHHFWSSDWYTCQKGETQKGWIMTQQHVSCVTTGNLLCLTFLYRKQQCLPPLIWQVKRLFLI